ncbi:MAG TPA: XdhC family protein [Mycobacteriales bacterium]|nr:XdhC family protein [Mycobacteriales bacterium]
MYEIALTVSACLRAGTRVDVAWAVETHGFSSRDHSEALALTPGGGRTGSVLSGSLNDQLADAAASSTTGRLVALHIGDVDATLAGLSCGGDARCLLVSAAELPAELWPHLQLRLPVCLITRLAGDHIVETTMFTADSIADAGEDIAEMFRHGVSDTTMSADTVVTVLWPVPKLVIIGGGATADALAAAAGLLGWHAVTVNDASSAIGLIAGLAAMDNVAVLSHDLEVGGPALEAALGSGVGYIGALGARRTQQARAQWLADHGITELDRIHGPAGLDIGANTPAEIAVSIVAEALATKTGSSVASLRELSGPIH